MDASASDKYPEYMEDTEKWHCFANDRYDAVLQRTTSPSNFNGWTLKRAVYRQLEVARKCFGSSLEHLQGYTEAGYQDCFTTLWGMWGNSTDRDANRWRTHLKRKIFWWPIHCALSRKTGLFARFAAESASQSSKSTFLAQMFDAVWAFKWLLYRRIFQSKLCWLENSFANSEVLYIILTW